MNLAVVSMAVGMNRRQWMHRLAIGPPAAAGPNITYNIDARGADREGLNRLTAAIRQLDGKVNYLDRTMDRRAVNAMAYARSRGGNIARAFGGW